MRTLRYSSVIVAIALFLLPVGLQAQDYVTEEEEDLIRDAQGLTLRVPLLIKFQDNRIVALGLRERTPKERLPRSLSMTLPTSNVAIDVNVVWQKPSGSSGWLCGAAIPDTSQTTWRQLVDAVSV